MSIYLILIQFIIIIGAFFYFRRKIDQLFSAKKILEPIRDEVDQLVLEINQTAEQNVLLLEQRVKTLKTLLDDADKKLTVLQKESEKSDMSRQVYSHLKKGNFGSEVEIEAQPSKTPSHKKTENKDSLSLPLFELVSEPPNSPEPVEKSFREGVMDLYSQGFSSEIISHKLGRSIAEVDLIITLNTGNGGRES